MAKSCIKITFSGGASVPAGDTSGSEEEDEVMQGRVSSAQLYALGPVTADRAFEIVKGRADAKKKAAEALEGRKKAQMEGKEEKLHMLREGVESITKPSKEEIKALTIPKLQGLLLRDDGHHWEASHTKLTKKANLCDT